MAPFHHHFELAGWAETTVIIRFWLLAAHVRGAGAGAVLQRVADGVVGIARDRDEPGPRRLRGPGAGRRGRDLRARPPRRRCWSGRAGDGSRRRAGALADLPAGAEPCGTPTELPAGTALVVPAGPAPDHPLVAAAAVGRARVIGEPSWPGGWPAAAEPAGVAGRDRTNGKTTTTGWLAAILRAAGVDAVACGTSATRWSTRCGPARCSRSSCRASSCTGRRRSGRPGLRAQRRRGPPGLARLDGRLRRRQGQGLARPATGRWPASTTRPPRRCAGRPGARRRPPSARPGPDQSGSSPGSGRPGTWRGLLAGGRRAPPRPPPWPTPSPPPRWPWPWAPTRPAWPGGGRTSGPGAPAGGGRRGPWGQVRERLQGHQPARRRPRWPRCLPRVVWIVGGRNKGGRRRPGRRGARPAGRRWCRSGRRPRS